ncbi:HDOD domain-containing protein [Shewanella cyperi]|uniref:HDOD domain-containing protein n=1 Tax=Shewanella cyperi TaxID=2814292 RepID=A0A974XJB4_9GAMM|nr:HDOD domain-containing protein [Shewanella cyperi]QSX29467.1 HDOD domain-containing protein [Shewanella cyperi]QSX40242.1 HDOD domain-containing protein [Shewanella cyperi]
MAISVAGGIRPGQVIAIERRLYQQLIVGKLKNQPVLDEVDVELEAAAHKLEIERAAVFERLQKQLQAREVFDAVSAQLIDTVARDIELNLAEPKRLLPKIGLSENQLSLLEMLHLANPEFNRMRLLISDLHFLVRDLTNMVNSPAFRLRHPQRADVRVVDIKLVMNFIGLENLRTLIPYYCLRNWLPSGHTSLLWTNRKLWRYCIMTARAAQALGKLHERNEALLYGTSMMSQLGTCAVLGCCAAAFEKLWGTWLREASASRDKEVYDAVMATELPPDLLLNQVLEYAGHFNWMLPELCKFSDSPMVNLLRELDQQPSFAELSLDAKLLAKASCFIRVMLLEEARMLEPQERRLMYDYYELSEQEVLRLKAQNYRKIDLF